MITLFIRDIRLAVRRAGDILSYVGFFLMIATLFPLAIGPDEATLSLVASSVLWIAVLLAAIPSFDRLYYDDYHYGFFDQLILRRTSLFDYAIMRVVSHFLVMGVPLLLSLPIMGLFFAIEASKLILIAGMIAIGLFALTCLGSIGASLTLGARRSGLLSAVLILPLAFPILIFGTLASQAVLDDTAYGAHLALLGSAALFLSMISPIATLFSLRIALEEQ